MLKGNETVITDGELLKINVAGTPALATMGTGDVLAGMITSYAALHKNPFESAVAAVHAHSMIADALYVKKGLHITAQHIIDNMAETLRQFDIVKR